MDRGEIARLAWAMTHPPVYHTGISESAFRSLCQTIETLGHAEPPTFDYPIEASVSRTIRFMAAVLPDSVPDNKVSVSISRIIANPHLPAAVVTTIIQGGRDSQHAGRHPVSTLREVGKRLRDGQTQRSIAKDLGVDRDGVVKPLSKFLGVVEARESRMRDDAMDQLEEGRADPQEFAEQHGVTTRTARKILASVRNALEPSTLGAAT